VLHTNRTLKKIPPEEKGILTEPESFLFIDVPTDWLPDHRPVGLLGVRVRPRACHWGACPLGVILAFSSPRVSRKVSFQPGFAEELQVELLTEFCFDTKAPAPRTSPSGPPKTKEKRALLVVQRDLPRCTEYGGVRTTKCQVVARTHDKKK
jgi:hypothetical protein